jgi:hypothetical protein
MRRSTLIAFSVFVLTMLSAQVALALPAGSWVEPTTVLTTVSLQAGRVYFGWAIAELHDVTGDGVTDFIASAPQLDSKRGAAFVYSGADGTPLFRFDGRPKDQAGWGIADAGDVNGDGIHDVLVGAPSVSGPGRTDVYSGANGRLLRSFSGAADGDRFGYAVAGIGDVNGDGRDDVAVGAPGNDAGGTNAGLVTIFSGRRGTVLDTTVGAAGSRLGVGLDGIGDVDGDGVPDVGAGARDGGPGQRGQVSAISGADGSTAWVRDAAPSGVDFGTFFVGGLPDVTGDGTPDVYAADYSDVSLGADTGRAYVLSGADGSSVFEIAGSSAGQGLGPGREAGDVDADGTMDLIIGSYLSPDGAPNAGKVDIVSGATGRILRTITSSTGGSEVGFDAVTLGDVNGDGIPDELVSAANRNDVYVIAGVRA